MPRPVRAENVMAHEVKRMGKGYIGRYYRHIASGLWFLVIDSLQAEGKDRVLLYRRAWGDRQGNWTWWEMQDFHEEFEGDEPI